MRRYYNKNLKNFARKLRKNMTEAEVRLWNQIKGKQIANLQFYRQKPLGNYIVDFYCPAKKLVIEIDGGQHYENGKIIIEDENRERFLKKVLKLRVVRFTNTDVMKNMEGVVNRIIELVK